MQNSLFQLEQFEKQITKKRFKDFKCLTVTFGGPSLSTMYISSAGKPLIALKPDRSIIHQIGAKLYGYDLLWADVYASWYRDLINNPVEFGQRLVNVLTEEDFTALMFRSNGATGLYGIVSGRSLNVSQQKLRYEILANLIDAGVHVKRSRLQVNKEGILEEVFETSLLSKRISYNYVISFAKNNNYDLMKLNWERNVIICRNGLMRHDESAGISWNYSTELPVKQLVKESIEKVVDQREAVEEKIDRAAASRIHCDDLSEFMNRVNIEKEKKPLIEKQIKLESTFSKRPSEWHLSQALTFLATHSEEINPNSKIHLRHAGTAILDYTLFDYLMKEVSPQGNLQNMPLLPSSWRMDS